MSEEIIEKYKKKINDALSGGDNETDHEFYDRVLEKLIIELGYKCLIEYAEKLIEEREISFWFA